MPPPKSIQELTQLFEGLEDRELRAELLIETGDRFVEVPAAIATRPYPLSHQVPACQSDVYLWAHRTATGIALEFAVVNPQGISARAMAVILKEAFADATLSEILAIDPGIVTMLFGKGIAMGKGQGLTSMLTTAQALARKLLE